MAKSNGIGRKIKKIFRLPYIYYLKCRGMKIHFTSSMPINTIIENYNCIEIGKHCNFDKRSCFRVYKNGKCNSRISIEDNFNSASDLRILCCGLVKIGKNVSCAGNVFITSENHGLNPMTKSFNDNELEFSDVEIEDGVWIGEKVIILPGVTIGKKSIIGAGSVVTKDIPPYSIAVGNPAKIIKQWDFSKCEYKRIVNERK